MFAEMAGAVFDFLERYRSPLLGAMVVAALWVAYVFATRAVRRHLGKTGEKPANIRSFLFVWRYVWLAVGLIFVLVAFSGSLVSLGISAAFLGMILGWSLQAPVTGIAAWLMIIVKKPFRIGDRVIIAGIVGDVTDITLTHVVMNQVGGTIGGEEKSGRGVLIPNAILFQQIIYNYAFESRYVLDEVPVLIAYENDLAEAERILLAAAREVTKDIVQETGQEPFTRIEVAEWGIRIRLRYQASATDRQRTSSDIVRRVIAEFNKSDRVEFCYPHSEVVHHAKKDFRWRSEVKEGPPPA